jgi:hypothetical protein
MRHRTPVRSWRRQRDPEPGHGQTEQHLSGSQQVGDLGCGEQFELSQPITVSVGALQSCPLQFGNVQPHLVSSLPEETPRAQPIRGRKNPIEHAACAARVILRCHPRRQDPIDAFMITTTPANQHRVFEIMIVDYRKGRCR